MRGVFPEIFDEGVLHGSPNPDWYFRAKTVIFQTHF